MNSEASSLAAVIAEFVPPFVLLELSHPDVELDVASWRNDATGRERPKLELAERVVDAFDRRGLMSSLAKMLYRRLSSDDLVAAKFVPFAKDDPDDNQQAALAYRALMLQQSELRDFLAKCEPRICMVFAPGKERTVSRGTGFLIGPDRILTAWHVINWGLGRTDRDTLDQYCAVFDHTSGPALNSIDDIPRTARKVMFAPDWQNVATLREKLGTDGTLAEPTPSEIKELQEKLDFAVIRLAEPIGLETRTPTGGERRGWFDVRDFRKLNTDQRVIIPQHPMGFRQQIDFGRFKKECPSTTRIRYDTETAKGTSGAPCFDEKYRLVGMHNAAYRPDGVDLFNQAIRFDWIAPLLPPVDNSVPPPATQIWSTAAASKPILGRRLLIEWIDRAMAVTAPVADQIFAAEGQIAKSGRSFTVDILREKVRARGDPVIELGTTLSPLPESVEDIMTTIVDQLALPRAVLAGMPPRPDKNESDGSKKGATWASKQIPKWFGDVLADNRQFRVSLFDYVLELQKWGQAAFDASATDKEREQGRTFELTPEQQAILKAADGKVESRSRWQLIWIVLRLRYKQKLPAELRDLLASLVQTVEGGNSEIGRIRWLFVETIPDFITILDPRSKEVLNPAEIGETELRNCWRGLADAANYPFDENDPPVAAGLGFLPDLATDLAIEMRLPTFQKFMLRLAASYRKTMIERGLAPA